MNYVKLIAPAKVNLALAVGDMRPDGFHQVDTVMHALALHDVIELYRYTSQPEEAPSKSGAGASDAPGAALHNDTNLTVSITNELDSGVGLQVSTEENIIYKALTQFARALGRTQPEEIQVVVKKHIPCEAGLGGGSSDAAATLLGAAALWGVDAEDQRLKQVACQLGSDVLFFLHGGCVYLKGKGDEFAKELVPRKDFCVIARPQTGVSTKQAYQEFDAHPVAVAEEYLKNLTQLESAADVVLANNMTSAARTLNADVDALLAFLEAQTQVPAHVLCGSGSAVCVMASSYDEAMFLVVALEQAGYWTRVTSFARVGAQIMESA